MKAIIEKFYTGFGRFDAEEMIRCYHPEIVFQDPAFGQLEGEHACNMWRMLCENQRDKDARITFSEVRSDGNVGSANWEAFYTFSRTGRKVHNIIQATFEFKEDLIIKHIDHFNLYRWSRQAIGTTGFLIGWTPFFQKQLQTQTNALLRKFESKM